MKIQLLILASVILLWSAARARPEPPADVQLVQIGRGFATTAERRPGDAVRIRVKEKGDGMKDAIVLSRFTPAQVKLTRGSEAGVELKRWPKAEVEAGQVLVYTLEEAAHIGVELQGSTNSRMEAVRRGDSFELTFTSITERWVLEVKFTSPEF
ncbi:MAG TPA: hypothetical protein P5567_13330 [Kiritimatiellia bacterium]|nr:hypothetical protein [Kiritimatiellia bacterium]HRZ13425.1 hypothetical protein [Kiritimatiellia bacterium]HSA18935.1 hypothetical protein [Kiritimatiellia bacterium]